MSDFFPLLVKQPAHLNLVSEFSAVDIIYFHCYDMVAVTAQANGLWTNNFTTRSISYLFWKLLILSQDINQRQRPGMNSDALRRSLCIHSKHTAISENT